jgi:hypothetical protein
MAFGEDSGMDEEDVGRSTEAVQETGARTLLSRSLFKKLAIAVLAELTENDGQSRAASLTPKAFEYFHQASEVHMQRVGKDSNTIATKVRSKAVGLPVDLRVGQYRGVPSTLETVLERVAAKGECGCPLGQSDSISNFGIKKFTKASGFVRVGEVFCQEWRLTLYRFMRVTLHYAVMVMLKTHRTWLGNDDLDLAMRHCARSFL